MVMNLKTFLSAMGKAQILQNKCAGTISFTKLREIHSFKNIVVKKRGDVHPFL